MVDAILSVLALAALIFFLGIIVWFVREPVLFFVLMIGVVGAGYDFWRSFQLRQSGGWE